MTAKGPQEYNHKLFRGQHDDELTRKRFPHYLSVIVAVEGRTRWFGTYWCLVLRNLIFICCVSEAQSISKLNSPPWWRGYILQCCCLPFRDHDVLIGIWRQTHFLINILALYDWQLALNSRCWCFKSITRRRFFDSCFRVTESGQIPIAIFFTKYSLKYCFTKLIIVICQVNVVIYLSCLFDLMQTCAYTLHICNLHIEDTDRDIGIIIYISYTI